MTTEAEFLKERLENIGLKHIFTVPGDYILPFCSKLSDSSKLSLINCTDENHAGFAADGYARVHGVGCVIATWNVGALKLSNAIAGAYAERSPVIVISGSPGISERSDLPLHHMVTNYEGQQEVFENFTCARAVLDNPAEAGYEIDRVLEAMRYYKQPVYIELPRDQANKIITYDVYRQGTPKSHQSDVKNLEESLKEVTTWISQATKPVILAGVELARFRLGKELIRFCEQNNIPVATTLLSKSVVNELHPYFMGVYAGGNTSQPHVQQMIEESDCLLVLGEVLTETTVGYRPSKVFEKHEMVTCTVDGMKVRGHTYPNVRFVDFCKALFKTQVQRPKLELPAKVLPEKFMPNGNAKMTTLRFFEMVNGILDENTVVIADTGDSLWGAADLMTVHEADTFIGPAFYLSMGFAIPAALGVKLAKPKCRPIVIVGDGSVQMSFSEISTHIREKSNAIFFILNNGGYTTERVLLDGKFNDILNWKYHLITDMMGGGKGYEVNTEAELASAVKSALKSDEVSVINVCVDKTDYSPALKRMTSGLAKRL
jgi:indolepyruvate decarboxylase